MHTPYVQVEFQTDHELRERLTGVMAQLGFEGFWEEGATLRCFIRSDRWLPSMREEVLSIAQIMAQASSTATPHVSVCTIDDRNWNEEWKKTLTPIRATDRIVIAPSWNTYSPTPDEILLTIDPKMSFGTGYHESTRLALKLVEKHLKPGAHVLDIGTGTGILAIAAIKLGAGSAVGVDTDEWSWANALENARLNDVADRVMVIHGDISAVSSVRFDLIAANIQRNVLERLLGSLRGLLEVSGCAVLSGLLLEDKEPMHASLQENGFECIEEMGENEWVACAARITPHIELHR